MNSKLTLAFRRLPCKDQTDIAQAAANLGLENMAPSERDIESYIAYKNGEISSEENISRAIAEALS